MFNFGSGRAFINPIGGNLATNPTPTEGLTLQDLSLDISQELVEQRGQYKFPDDVAPGDMKISGKLVIGRWDIDMFNQIMFGDVRAIGSKIVSANETHSIPATTPFTIAVSSTVFGTDLGVLYVGNPPAGNQIKLDRVATSPATGQYAVSAGTYTFAAADEGLGVQISYQYSPASPAGFTVQANQQLMGYGPVSEIYFQMPYNSNSAGLASIIHLTQVRFSKLSAPIKRKGYTDVELDFMAYANTAGLAIEFTNPGVA